MNCKEEWEHGSANLGVSKRLELAHHLNAFEDWLRKKIEQDFIDLVCFEKFTTHTPRMDATHQAYCVTIQKACAFHGVRNRPIYSRSIQKNIGGKLGASDGEILITIQDLKFETDPVDWNIRRAKAVAGLLCCLENEKIYPGWDELMKKIIACYGSVISFRDEAGYVHSQSLKNALVSMRPKDKKLKEALLCMLDKKMTLKNEKQ